MDRQAVLCIALMAGCEKPDPLNSVNEGKLAEFPDKTVGEIFNNYKGYQSKGYKSVTWKWSAAEKTDGKDHVTFEAVRNIEGYRMLCEFLSGAEHQECMNVFANLFKVLDRFVFTVNENDEVIIERFGR